MRTIRFALVATVASLAMSVAGVATASAHEFIAKPGSGELEGKALKTQVFKTSAGNVECTTLSVTEAPITAEKETTQNATVHYSGCTAFGLSATISPAKYTFNANGEVTVRETIKIEAGFGSCEVTVPPQTVKSVEYVNKSGKIEIVPKVMGITSSGTGSCAYSSESKGTYVGESEVSRKGGGTIEWK